MKISYSSVRNAPTNGSTQLTKLIDWVLYKGTTKPSESLSDSRWQGMVKHILREYVLLLKK